MTTRKLCGEETGKTRVAGVRVSAAALGGEGGFRGGGGDFLFVPTYIRDLYSSSFFVFR